MKTTTDPAILAPLFAYLDELSGPADIKRLRQILESLDLTREDFGEHVNFCDTNYERNLIREGQWYQAFCICWKNGQRSSIHDHAQAVCGVRVVKGSCTETKYKHCCKGQVVATGSCEMHEGQVCVSVESETHQISNLSDDGSDLITLHIYSPPMREFRTFDVVNGTITIVRDNGDGCCTPVRTYRCDEESK